MIRLPRLGTSLILIATCLLVAPVTAAAQQMTPSMLVQTTPTYTVILQIGPVAEMLPADQSSMRGSGEVMVGTVGVPMTGTDQSMSMGAHEMGMSAGTQSGGMGTMSDMADQGMAVNHHLEVHITDNSSGAIVNDVSPVIRVRDDSTGVSRDLNDVMAMYDAQMGPSDFHYGQNVWLPDGQYDITVMLGTQSAQFRDVAVAGGEMPMMMGH